MFGRAKTDFFRLLQTDRGTVLWLSVLLVFCVVCSLSDGFDTLSFHFTMALAPLLSMAVASICVSCFNPVLQKKYSFSLALRKSLVYTAFLVLFPLFFMIAKGAVTYFCDLPRGLLFYFMGPSLSALFAFSLAMFLSSFTTMARPVFASIFLFSFAYNLGELYFTPAIFFYNPFLGYYPGAIYDVALEVSPAYWAFRGFCLLLLSGFFIVGYLRFNHFLGRTPLLYAGFLPSALIMFAMGPSLGFRGSETRILAELDHVLADPYCIIRYDGSMNDRLVRLLLEECSYAHKQSALFFGVESAPPIVVFLYKDDEQKARLMGARDVEVSKPWLGQVHIAQVAPHQKTLAHEIAHVVAGRLLSNPLKIPLRFGFVPDMALVEGIAVAFAFYDDAPSPHEEALAFLQAGHEKDIEKVARPLGFMLEKPEKAYLLMGSLLRFIHDYYGLEAFQKVVKGGSVGEGAQKDSYPVQKWVEFLKAEGEPTVTQDMVTWTASLLSGPGVLGVKCPTDSAYLLRKAQQRFASLDLGEALKLVERARALDAGNERALFEALRVCAWSDEKDFCSDTQKDIARTSAPLSVQATIALADARAIQSLLVSADVDKDVISVLYSALSTTNQEQVRRAISVRLKVLDMPVEVALLAYKALTGFGDDPVLFLEEATAMVPDNEVIHYLLARGLCAQGDYVGCLSHSQCALALGMSEDFYLESVMLSFKSAVFAKDWAVAKKLGGVLLEKAPFKGQKEWVRELLSRVDSAPISAIR